MEKSESHGQIAAIGLAGGITWPAVGWRVTGMVWFGDIVCRVLSLVVETSTAVGIHRQVLCLRVHNSSSPGVWSVLSSPYLLYKLCHGRSSPLLSSSIFFQQLDVGYTSDSVSLPVVALSWIQILVYCSSSNSDPCSNDNMVWQYSLRLTILCNVNWMLDYYEEGMLQAKKYWKITKDLLQQIRAKMNLVTS